MLTSGLSILMHGVILISDATSFDNFFYHMMLRLGVK